LTDGMGSCRPRAGGFLIALYRLLRVQERPVGPRHARRPAEPDRRLAAAPEALADDPFAEADRFLRVPLRKRESPATGTAKDGFSELVNMVGDRAAATRLVSFAGTVRPQASA
jgi:hypothetical protein